MRKWLSASDADVEEYQGRERITSRTKDVQGKVFYPKILEGNMEAITVDYEKDPVLKGYIEHLETSCQSLFDRLKAAGKEMTFKHFLQLINSKIMIDFPYEEKMRERAYRETRFLISKRIKKKTIRQDVG